MQSALTRLYTSGPFFEWFCIDPDTVLDQYDLTPREASAIAGIDREAVKRFAISLRFKTWGRFKSPYRLVHAVDTLTVRKYFMRFYQLRPIRPNEAFYDPNLEFGEFLERSFSGNPEMPPYAGDLARYERLFHKARFEPRSPGTSPTSERLTVDAPTPACVARRCPGIHIESFDYDMGALEKSLRDETVPEDVEKKPRHVVFQSFEQIGRAKKFQISAAMANLVALCDGENDLAAVASALEAEPEAVLEAARKLMELRLLEEVKAS